MNKMITQMELCRAFRAVGIARGDLLMVHSALTAIGRVDGGAAAVVDALLEVLGSEGTLMVPTLSFTHPFDPAATPSAVGAISENVRLRPQAVRSLHPIHSVAAIGRDAAAVCAGHDQSDTGCGRPSPYLKLIERDGKILLLGVDQDRNTTLHTLEYLAQADYFRDVRLPAPNYAPYWGQGEFVLPGFPGGHRNFIGVTPLLRRAGVVRHGLAGQAVLQLMSAKALHDTLMPELKRDPHLFLCNNAACSFCMEARRRKAERDAEVKDR